MIFYYLSPLKTFNGSSKKMESEIPAYVTYLENKKGRKAFHPCLQVGSSSGTLFFFPLLVRT